MSKVLVTESNLQDIADAIRSKNQGTDTYRPGDMAAAILAIPTGGGSTLVSKTITQNGEYDPEDDNADGYSDVTVNVPNSYTAEDEGKVVSSGALVAQTSKTVTENGTYDTTENDEVVVNVSGGGGEDPFSLTDYIESSGTQYIDTGYIVKDNSRFDVVYNTNATQPPYPTLFGVRDNDSGATAGRCTFFVKHGNFSAGSYAWGTADAGMGLSGWMYLSAKKQRCVFTKGSLLVQQVDGNALVFDFTSPYSASNTRSVYIFTLNQGGADFGAATHFSGKLYRFRIYEGDTLVHEYVPWTDGNDVVCLKDTVTSNLLYNAGTGNFVRGSDI